MNLVGRISSVYVYMFVLEEQHALHIISWLAQLGYFGDF